MPHVAIDSDMGEFDDVEVVSFRAGTDTAGTSVVEDGLELVDYDEVVDRNETLVLLQAHHSLSVKFSGISTDKVDVVARGEVSASPALSDAAEIGGTGSDTSGFDDTIDVIGRVLQVVATNVIEDETNGTGAGPARYGDSTELVNPPRQLAEFHPRDELFFNFRKVQNTALNLNAQLVGQHIYGVESAD